MRQIVLAAATLAAAPDLDVSAVLLEAARALRLQLQRGQRIDAAILRAAMEDAPGASGASGAWRWKPAHDPSDAALVILLRQYGPR